MANCNVPEKGQFREITPNLHKSSWLEASGPTYSVGRQDLRILFALIVDYQQISDFSPQPFYQEMDRDDELFFRRNNLQLEINTNAVVRAAQSLTATKKARRIRNDRPLTGREYIMDILGGHPDRCFDLYRMNPTTFKILCAEVSRKGIIKTDEVTTEEQVGMFLQALAHSSTRRKVAEDFQRSKETVQRCFGDVLESVLKMRRRYMKLPRGNAPIPAKVSPNGPNYPFKDALGAIDGTYIQCIPPTLDPNKEKWRCRKTMKAQNVLVAVDFNGNFVYVLAGFEGAAHDNMVLQEALARFNFHVPLDRFYLADMGYANTRNFITPYRNHPYWMSSFRGRSPYTCPEDLYNHRHAQLRNIVENTFGVLKKRWKVLELMRNYAYKRQCKVVIACCILHNFIRKHTNEPVPEEEREEEDEPDAELAAQIDAQATDLGEQIRAGIRDTLWADRAN